MPTQAAVGKSTNRDTTQAALEATRAALAGLAGQPADLCLVFATSGFDQRLLISTIREASGGARLCGCSGEGVIAGPTSHEGEFAVAVLALRSDSIAFEPFLVRNYSNDPRATGAALAHELRTRSRGDERALVIFPDGLRGNCGALLDGLDCELAGSVPVFGGSAGDAMALEATYQYCDDEAVSDSVSAVIIRGRCRVELAVSHGCTRIGIERRATRTEGGWLRQIDQRPAWDVYREYLGPEQHDLNAEGMAHLCIGEPLPVEAGLDNEPFIIHTPLGFDQESGSLFFPGGGVREGTRIHFTRRDPQQVRERARDCAARIARRAPDRKPAFVLQFDCAGRGRLLFGSHVAEEIVVPLQKELGPESPWIGFHTYGEIAAIGARTHFHNYTVVLAAIYDDP